MWVLLNASVLRMLKDMDDGSVDGRMSNQWNRDEVTSRCTLGVVTLLTDSDSGLIHIRVWNKVSQ